MATIYVDSAAAGTNAGTSWTNAFTSITSTTSAAAGDVIRIASGHSEGGGNTPIAWVGSPSNPVVIISTNKSNDTYLAGATLSGFYQIDGSISVFGVHWKNSSLNFNASGGALAKKQYHEDCVLEIDYTGDFATTTLYVGGNQTGATYFVNCTWKEDNRGGGVTGNAIRIQEGGVIKFVNLTHLPTGGPTAAAFMIFGSDAIYNSTNVEVIGMDLSEFSNLVDAGTADKIDITFRRCKLKSGYTSVDQTDFQWDGKVLVESCAVGTLTTAPLGLVSLTKQGGIVSTDLTHYRTGGADDGEQANAQSWAMAASSAAKNFVSPLESPKMLIWVDAGSHTVTMYVASGVTLKDDEFWIDVISPNETASPNTTGQAKYNLTRAATLFTTPSNLTTDGGSTWNGSGVGTKQKIAVSINPGVSGWVEVRAFLAKASTTVYVDPLVGVA